MAHKEVTIDSVRHAIVTGKWVTILKRMDADEYFPIYMNASQACRLASRMDLINTVSKQA